jgi:hypothetical protein
MTWMATLRQYFDTGFSRVLSVHRIWQMEDSGKTVPVIARLHFDFDANAKYASCFVPECGNPSAACRGLLDQLDELLKVDDGTLVQAGFAGLGEELTDSRELRFTGRIFIYMESDVPVEDRYGLRQLAASRELSLRIRGPGFAMKKAELEKPLAFISHDSRDKDAVARPVAIGLSRLMCPVWYDEFSLRVGDPLRESIEKGLKECKKCILVLSPNFLSNNGWTKVEFNSIFTREILEQQKLVLPVWHNVTKEAIFEYSPSLLNVKGLDWNKVGEEEVCRQLCQVIVQ